MIWFVQDWEYLWANTIPQGAARHHKYRLGVVSSNFGDLTRTPSNNLAFFSAKKIVKNAWSTWSTGRTRGIFDRTEFNVSSEDMKIRNTQRMVTMNDELDVTQRDNEGNPSQ